MFKNKVREHLGLKKCGGDIGIEIEAEMEHPWGVYDLTPFKEVWRIEEDGSLKYNGIEFVLKKPVKFSKVSSLIEGFLNKKKEAGIVFRNSVRAGIHAHLNVQENTFEDVFKLAVVYYMLETVLLKSCGNGRESNLFCLRARDAEGILESLEECISNEDIHTIHTDNFRYAALNFQSLYKYGSLEFRSFATSPSLEDLEEWVETIAALKKYALNSNNVWSIISGISAEGPDSWAREVLGEKLADKLLYEGSENDIIQDMRRVQTLAFLLGEKGI